MQAAALFSALRQAAEPAVAAAIERLVAQGPDRALCRINALAFAASHALAEEPTIAGFLHAAKLGLFEMSWNVLCPGCGGVLDSGASLKSIHQEQYHCALCAAGYEPSLDERVEVSFTVSPRLRAIAAHDPDRLPPFEYYRQVFFSTGVDLRDDFEERFAAAILAMVELPPGEKAVLSLELPAQFAILFDAVTHSAQFLDVQGEPTPQTQVLSMVVSNGHELNEAVTLRPGPLRLALENHSDRRVLPNLCVAGDDLHAILERRRPFLTAKRLLTTQTFRDLHRTESLTVDQRLKLASLTFLFTDLRGSTALYERVGDLAAFDLVRAHFRVLQNIVAAEQGAVVKTIGDAVMATFPSPDKGLSAALKMRAAMRDLNSQRRCDDFVLKIGIHEGPCLAVSLNDRQDYFGQTVNIAARVQGLADPQAILATASVVDDEAARDLLLRSGVAPVRRPVVLRGMAREVPIYALT
ncbi:DUF5939 domain-containing protein [Alsobacter sp. SYSU BS001988]